MTDDGLRKGAQLVTWEEQLQLAPTQPILALTFLLQVVALGPPSGGSGCGPGSAALLPVQACRRSRSACTGCDGGLQPGAVLSRHQDVCEGTEAGGKGRMNV
jgi:hypothetical protein